MKIVKQIVILFGVCLLSETISNIIPFPMPGSVISLLLIAAGLCTKVLKENDIQETADFLLKIMAMLFVPAGIGVLEEISAVQGILLEVITVILVAIITTCIGAYFTSLWVIKIQQRRQ